MVLRRKHKARRGLACQFCGAETEHVAESPDPKAVYEHSGLTMVMICDECYEKRRNEAEV